MGTSWKVWLVRSSITMLLGGAAATAISFAVADYIVRANTSSANEAMRALQSSIDRLNQSTLANNAALGKMSDQIGGLTAESRTQLVEIGYLRRDLARVTKAVQESGIAIPASSEGAFFINPKKFEALRAKYGLGDDDPVFLSVEPWKALP